MGATKNGRPFLRAEWRYLAMLNYDVAPAVLRPYVPAGTELDAYEGRTLVSVVGFRFLNTRVLGLPVPFHRNFDEVNLRFYVRRAGPEGWRRGVVFVRELVPRRSIAWVARLAYNEPYRAVPMRHAVNVERAHEGGSGAVRYEWRRRRRWYGLAATIDGSPTLPAEGSEEEFITEHYWGYTAQRDGGTKEYCVAHPQWPVWKARDAALHGDVAGFYGDPFAGALGGSPCSAFVATGSEVTVFSGRRLMQQRPRVEGS